MRLVMFSPKGMELDRGWPGRIEGDTVVQMAAQTLQVFFTAGAPLRDHATYPLADVELRAPVMYPPAIRVFEDDDFWFANVEAVRGPGAEIAAPADELYATAALAAVIGNEGAIGGFTGSILWTAPSLPGAKARDFAISLGPLVVTADEFDAGAEWETRRELAERNTALRPGDLLVAPVADPVLAGHTISLEIPGIGELGAGVS